MARHTQAYCVSNKKRSREFKLREPDKTENLDAITVSATSSATEKWKSQGSADYMELFRNHCRSLDARVRV